MHKPFLIGLLSSLCTLCLCGHSFSADWLLAKAYKLPSEYTNQESGYFSIIEGQNRKMYIGSAKYGVNAYLLEFDPKTENADGHGRPFGHRIDGHRRRPGQAAHPQQRRHRDRQDLRRVQAGNPENEVPRPVPGGTS